MVTLDEAMEDPKGELTGALSRLLAEGGISPEEQQRFLQRGVCPMCWGFGWVLDCNNTQDDRVHVELLPCFYPECEVEPKEIERLVFKGPYFDEAARLPSGQVTSVGKWK